MRRPFLLSLVLVGVLAGDAVAQAESGSDDRFRERWPRVAQWMDSIAEAAPVAVIVLQPDQEPQMHCAGGLTPETPIPLFHETFALRAAALGALREREEWAPEMAVSEVLHELAGEQEGVWSRIPISALEAGRVRMRLVRALRYRGWVVHEETARSAAAVTRESLHRPFADDRARSPSNESAPVAQWLIEREFERSWARVLREIVAPRLGLPPKDLFERSPPGALRCAGFVTAKVGDRVFDRADAVVECAAEDAAAIRLSSLHRFPMPEHGFPPWQPQLGDKLRAHWRGRQISPIRWFVVRGTRFVLVSSLFPFDLDPFEVAACSDLLGKRYEVEPSILGEGIGLPEWRFRGPVSARGRFAGPVRWRGHRADTRFEVDAEGTHVRVEIDGETREVPLLGFSREARSLHFALEYAERTRLEFVLRSAEGEWSGFVAERDLRSGGCFPFPVRFEPASRDRSAR